MCGRFTLTTEDAEELARALEVAPDEDFAGLYVPRWNVAPMQEHWIVVPEREDRRLRRATWGLVNGWETDRRAGAKLINARADGLEERRAFRDAFRLGRCLVPADGFYEWTGDARTRRPFWFHRPDRRPFAFAGLYETSRLPADPQPVTTFTIVTTTPNAVTGRIHDRMPVILPDEEAAAAWLERDQPAETLRALLRPAADDFLAARPVGSRVNSVLHDDAHCLDEAEPELQGPLL